MGTIQKTWGLVAIAIAAAGMAQAEVPPEIAKQLVAIGRGVCVPETAQIYRPLHPNPPYAGVSIARDISFGPDPKNVLDVFAPEKGGGSRPVLIYVSGGAGNKQQGGPNGDVFYDNVMLWAVKNGMVGVNMQRRPGQAWDDPAKDVALVVQWVGQNIAATKAIPSESSSGRNPLGTSPSAPTSAILSFMVPWGSGSREWFSCPLRASIFCRPRRLRSKADSRRAGSLTELPLPRPLDVDQVGQEELAEAATETRKRLRRTLPLNWLDPICRD